MLFLAYYEMETYLAMFSYDQLSPNKLFRQELIWKFAAYMKHHMRKNLFSCSKRELFGNKKEVCSHLLR